jgi:hypothetical protein
MKGKPERVRFPWRGGKTEEAARRTEATTPGGKPGLFDFAAGKLSACAGVQNRREMV